MTRRLMFCLFALYMATLLAAAADAATCLAWKKISGKNVCTKWSSGSVKNDIEGPQGSLPEGVEGLDYEVRVVGTGANCELTGRLFCAPASGNGVEAMSTSSNSFSFKPCPGAAKVLMIDEDSINNGRPPNFFTAKDVNDDIAKLGLRNQLRFFKNNMGQRIVLPTGRWWDEGWFALETVPASWAKGGPSTDGLENYVGVMQPNGTILVGDGLGRGKYPASKLHIVPGVTPLRAAGLQDLVGQQICAVVYDNDIKYNPWYGSLNGANLGRVAFKVIAVNEVTGAPCLSLPQVEIEILDADTVCGGKLYNAAPEGPGEVCLAEDGVVLPLTGSGLVATGTFDNCSDGKCQSSVTLEIDAEVGQAQCPAGTEFVSFVPNEFFGITTVFDTDPDPVTREDLIIREKCTTTDGLLYNCVPATEEEIPTCGPAPVPECNGQVYPYQDPCNLPQPEGGCLQPICISTPEGIGFCVEGFTSCVGLAPCTLSSDCGEGEVCAIGTGCTYPDHIYGVCAPADAFCPPAVATEAAAQIAAVPKPAAPEGGPTIGGSK